MSYDVLTTIRNNFVIRTIRGSRRGKEPHAGTADCRLGEETFYFFGKLHHTLANDVLHKRSSDDQLRNQRSVTLHLTCSHFHLKRGSLRAGPTRLSIASQP
jgi:hypothetical protein